MLKGSGRDPAILLCALNGEHNNSDTVPIHVDDLAAASRRAVDAGAAIVHLHVRDPRPAHHSQPVLDPERIEHVIRRVRAACPEVVISLGLGRDPGSTKLLGVVGERDWAEIVQCRPATVASLEGGDDESDALFRDVAFDRNAMLSARVGRWLVECAGVNGLRGLAHVLGSGVLGADPEHHCLVDLVVGSDADIPAEPGLLDFLVDHLPDGTRWLMTGRGRSEVWAMQRRAVELGGVLRTGLEDTAYRRDGTRARDNAELVADLAAMARDAGREIASPGQARALLGLAG